MVAWEGGVSLFRILPRRLEIVPGRREGVGAKSARVLDAMGWGLGAVRGAGEGVRIKTRGSRTDTEDAEKTKRRAALVGLDPGDDFG